MKKLANIFLSILVLTLLSITLIACGGNQNPTTYTLKFDMNGHGEQVVEQVLGKDELPTQPQKLEEEGYKFEGWYLDKECTDYYYFDEALEKDTTVYAKWTQLLTVSYITNVDGLNIENSYVEFGSLLTLPNAQTLVAKGKKFEGWYYDETLAVAFDVRTAITQSIPLYAKWSPYFKVTFDKNGKGQDSRVPASQEYTAEGSKAVRPEDMSANSHKFIGWSVDKDGINNLWDFENTVLTDSITLFAQWLRLYNVTFNLNNAEALQEAPDRQTVEEGAYATEPTQPVLSGYRFEGWYTEAEGGEKFDFATTPITSNTTVYAHWTKTGAGTFDVETPDVDYNKEAPYGERPDLDGFIIDGKMSESEKWADRNWFTTSTVDAPTVSYSLTTQFSEKGLYLFFIVKDNGGLYNAGNNLSYRNSHLEFAIADGELGEYHSSRVKTFTVDTYSLLPSYNRAKIAVYIADGIVNTPSMDNKSATMHVEAFITWKDLDIQDIPQSVKIETVYRYKRISSDTIKYSLVTPFTDGSSFDSLSEYVKYDKNGYTKKDAQNAVVGDSPYGTSKTTRWNISHESDENDAYVSTEGGKLQAIFFKEKQDSGYFEVSATLDASEVEGAGKAGIMVYANDLNYASLMFAVNNETYDKAQNKFIKARTQLRGTDNNGKELVVNIPELDVSDSGEINARVIFHNSYFYCVVNGVFIYCKYVGTLNNRVVPALVTEYCPSMRFRNYAIKVNTRTESEAEIGKYAYLIECAKNNSLTVELSSVGVAVDENVDKRLEMTITNSQLALTQAQRESVRESGVSALSSVSLTQIKKLGFEVNGTLYDITDSLDADASYGQFVYEYLFNGNGTLRSECESVDLSDMVALVGRVTDKDTGKNINASVVVTTSSPRLGRYECKVQNGDLVVLLPKGCEYRITVSQTTYRNRIIEGVADYEGVRDVGEVALIYNILGGLAYNSNGTLSIGSGAKGWDMTNESNNEIVLTTDFDPPTVYFTGMTVHKYQYAKVSVSNITDVNDYSEYEPDPAIGFHFYTEAKSAFLGLRKTGLRYRSDCSVWAPVQINGYGKDTCNHLDPTGQHKDTLEIIRMGRNLYSWINGTYMGHIVLDKEFEGDCAIGVQATIAFYGKIKYSDYEIKVADDAVAIAKEKIGVTLAYDESVYDWYEGVADLTKPYVTVDGLEIPEDKFALAGTTLKFSLSEYALDGVGYSVSVGSYGSVILTEQNPTAKFVLPTTAQGELDIRCNMFNICSVVGRVEGAEGPFEGVITVENGSVLAFTTGSDGSFSVGVPSSVRFSLELKVDGFVAPVLSSQTDASGEKNVGTITLYPSILGGKVKGTQYASSDGIYLGYDNDPLSEIDGLYADINVVTGDHYVAINDRTYDDFDLSYSLVREKYTDRANEADPGIGINVRTAMGTESLLFFRTGVRIITAEGWSKRIERVDLMPYNIATAYGESADFRIVRRGGMYVMFYKNPTSTEWIKVYTYESSIVGSAGLLFYSTNGTNNHYRIWNVKPEKITSQTLPEDLICKMSITNVSGESEGGISVVGGTVIEKTEYVLGDTVKFKLTPTIGNVVAYLKINDEYTAVENNEAVYRIKDATLDVEVAFEKEYVSVDARLRIVSEYELESVDVVAVIADGRRYEYKNLSVDEDGYVTVKIREGKFDIFADTDLITSKAVSVTVTPDTKELGTVTLDVLKPGSVTVNGKTLGLLSPMGEAGLRTDGAYTAPPRIQQHAYLPATLTSGDFVFSTTIIMSGDPNSIYYAVDNCTGVTFSDGTNRFAVQLWANGFRVYSGSYDSSKMIEPRFDGTYFYSTTSKENIEHKLTIARKGTSLKVFVDDEYYMTLDESGYSIKNESGSLFASQANKEAVGKLLADTFGGDPDKQIVVGYSTCINTQTAGHLNSAGFKNTSITNDSSIVDSYFD